MSVDDLDLLSEDYKVDHRLQLFLDVEVFEEEEELHSFLKVCKSEACRYLSGVALNRKKLQETVWHLTPNKTTESFVHIKLTRC